MELSALLQDIQSPGLITLHTIFLVVSILTRRLMIRYLLDSFLHHFVCLSPLLYLTIAMESLRCLIPTNSIFHFYNISPDHDLFLFEYTLFFSDGNTRNQAEAQLQVAFDSHYENALMSLCVELATEDRVVGNRIQAALYLKNLFTAQDEGIKQGKLAKWAAGR